MVPATLRVSASDNCDPSAVCKIVSVSSNEPVNGLGDGDTAPDWLITGDLTVNLRAERSGKGNGRIYTVTFECTDASGNSATGTTTVAVPHDQGNSKKVVAPVGQGNNNNNNNNNSNSNNNKNKNKDKNKNK
jgi:hypothetical protein